MITVVYRNDWPVVYVLGFDEAWWDRLHVPWRLVCWLVPRRLMRARAAGIGCKNWRRS